MELLDDSPVTPGETRPAYDGYEASKQIIIDAESALNEWTLDSAQVKPTLSFKQDYEDFEPEEGEEEEEEDGQGRWSEDEQEDGQIEEPEQEEEGAVEEHEQVGHQQSESLPQQTTA